jgi:hypothetical protein
MGGVRRLLQHRWFPFFAGALAGLIIAATCSATWHRSYNQPAVTLMGTGHGLSALVSTTSGRVLIVSGDNPIALANAFADARPPTMRRVEVVVITPGASTAVAERAVELAMPRRIMAIYSYEDEPDDAGIDDPIRDIVAPRTIKLGDELLIDIDPGLIGGQPDTGWSIRVQADAASVLLAASVPMRPAPEVGLIALMGATVSPSALSAMVPVAVAADISELPSGEFGTIAPGETRRIPIEPTSVMLPLAWARLADE